MRDLMKSWHDAHFLRTTPITHPRRWKRFNVTDRYNNGNRLTGHIQVKGGDEYGAMHIQTVNGELASQYVVATPKAAYPFNRKGHWIMEGWSDIEAYQKLDGTNIFQFVYRDADGQEYTTFKVRTRVGLSDRFAAMLDEVLEMVPGVRDLKLPFGTGVGYEMTGYGNPHHIRYDYRLGLHVLYGRQDGELFGYHDNPRFFDAIDCPRVDTHVWTSEEVELEYRYRQKVFANVTTEVDGHEEFYDGPEGDMMYVRFPDGAREVPGSFVRLIKCKSPVIEVIHWRSDKVVASEVRATAMNVWEVEDDPTVDDLRTMLAEEWTDLQIQMSSDTIERVWGEVRALRQWQDGVLETFREVSDLDEWRTRHGDTMRAIARTKRYKGSEMRGVFNTLTERLGA